MVAHGAGGVCDAARVYAGAREPGIDPTARAVLHSIYTLGCPLFTNIFFSEIG